VSTNLSVSADKFFDGAFELLAVVCLIGLFAATSQCGAGCKPVQDSLTDPAHNYTTEIVACAATAGYPGAYDRAADMRCRDGVNRRYNLAGSADGGR
jgi:hypothetical protein